MHHGQQPGDDGPDELPRRGRHRPGIIVVLASGFAIFGGVVAILANVLQIETTFGLPITTAGSVLGLFLVLFASAFGARPSRARSVTKSVCAVLAAITGIVFGVVLSRGTGRPSSHAVSGVVRCVTGAHVAGMYIADEKSLHGGGFVKSLDPIPATSSHPSETRFSFDDLIASSYKAHVGCGGTSANWGIVTYSGPIQSATVTLTCHDDPADAKYYGSCTTDV